MTRHVGVDLHRNSFVEGVKSQLRGFKLERIEQFKELLRPDDGVAVEATGNTRYFVESIADRPAAVKVLDPRKFKVISESAQKTDKNDARLIAYFLSKDMIPEIRLKSRNYCEVQSLAHTRDKLVKLRTILKNKVNNILARDGIVVKKESLSSKVGLQRALDAPVHDGSKIELRIIVDQIRSLTAGIADLEREMCERGSQLPGYESITGIGATSGSVLLSIIGDIQTFKSPKQLAAYFGIVPRVHESNGISKPGRITKEGSSLGRSVLVLCSWVAIQHSPYLRAFYERLKARKEAGRAIIATAKKLLSIIYDTLRQEWVFEDFKNFVIKAA